MIKKPFAILIVLCALSSCYLLEKKTDIVLDTGTSYQFLPYKGGIITVANKGGETLITFPDSTTAHLTTGGGVWPILHGDTLMIEHFSNDSIAIPGKGKFGACVLKMERSPMFRITHSETPLTLHEFKINMPENKVIFYSENGDIDTVAMGRLTFIGDTYYDYVLYRHERSVAFRSINPVNKRVFSTRIYLAALRKELGKPKPKE